MAVAFDAVGPSASGTTSATSPLTWTHVCGASATHLLVGATWDGSPDGGGSMSATYNSVPMTSLGVWHCGGGTAGFLQVWALASPATGSHSVSVTAAGSPGGINAGSVSFTGSTALSAVQSAVSAGAATNPTLAFTGSVSGNIVAAFVGGGSPQTPSGSFTSRYNENAGSGQQGAGYTACSTIASPGGSTAASWTMNSDFWAVAAVEVQAGSAAGDILRAARPGKTWRRRFHHRQVLPTPVFVPSTITATATIAAASAVTASASPPVIAGLGGTGAGYFADQFGSPRFVLGDAVWGLPGNAGRWSSGAWQSDFDTYTATRAGQGFTVIYTKPMGTTQNAGINDDGRTFDGLFPFQGGSFANPSTGLTSSYWARIDYFLNSALAQGLTVFMNAIGYDSDFETSGPLAGKSSTEFGAYGTALGARYASQVNLVWVVADDYFGGSTDTKISAFLTALRAAGDTHPITIENFPETTSRQDTSTGGATAWGASNAQYNWCYSYNVTYYGVEKAFLESSPITPIQGDGYFYQGGSSYAGGSGAFAFDRAIRQDAWHAISSGARGIIHGDEACWQWASTAQAAAAAAWYHQHNAGNIRALMESLPNWQLLIPDTSSLLVTAGRGTHASGFSSGGGGGQYEVSFADSYVTASRTAAGDLAVIYLSHATSITIDQTKMAAGYAAFWVDPITGAKTSTTAGSTYNSATPGNNSQGDPDWVLVLQASTVTGTAAIAAAGSVTAVATVIAPAAAAGAGSVTAVAAQIAGAAPAGAGAVTAKATQITGASLAGAGAVTAAGSVSGLASGSATVAGAGAVTAVASQAAVVAPAGAGQVTAVATVAATAPVAGAGSVTARATQAAVAAAAGAATVGPVAAVQAAGAAAAGAGSVSAAAVQAATAALAGAGSVTATGSAGGASTANLVATGVVTAVPTVAATATAAGAGAVTATVTQRGSAALTAAAAVTAAGAISGAATLAAAGAVSAKATQAATAQPAGAAALTALATQRATAALAAAGAVAATGTSAASIVQATSAPAVAAQRTSAPAVTGAVTAAAAVTSKAASSVAVSDG